MASKSLQTAGIALISIGIGLISYAWTQPLYVKIALIVIGVIFNAFAVISFVKVSNNSELANDIRDIQKVESQLSPFLQKYGNDIESAIEAMVTSGFNKLDEGYKQKIDDLQKQLDELKPKQ